MKEIEQDVNYDMVSTAYEIEEFFQNQREENNKIEGYDDFDKYYLKYIDKFNVQKIKIGIEFIFFIGILVENEVKKSSYTHTSNKKKIVIIDKKSNYQREIEINEDSRVDYIGEIIEENNEIIISLDNELYKLSKDNKLELIDSMSINHILQINKNEYICANNNGTFKYEGSLLEITKENLEIKEKKITDDICNFGVLINDTIIALAYSKRLILYNSNSNKIEKIFSYDNFCESCYAFFKSRFMMLFGTNKIENNILLFGCKKGKENGFLILDIENREDKFLGTGDFKVNCFLQISKNKKAIVEAFSEEYNKKYTYFLVGGYEHNQYKIKLYRFYLWKKEMKFIKDIGIEKNDLLDNDDDNEEPILKSIIQNKNMIIINIRGVALKLYIMNLEKEEKYELEENGNISLYEENEKYIRQNYGYYSYELKDVDMSIFNNNSIEYMQQLENGYFIIGQKNNISVAFVEDDCMSLCKTFKIPNSINCICEIKKSQVIICQNDGLYKLVLPNDGKNIDSVRLDKINDMKLNIFSNKNDYIISCEKGTFIVFRDIPSISYKDLNVQNKLNNKKYDKIEIIEINNHKYAILIDNKSLEIIELNNTQNRYKWEERNNNNFLLKDCIVSFKTKKDSDNHILICALKKGILFVDIRQKLNNSTSRICKLEKDVKITCMCPFKQNIQEEEFCSYFLIGGINDLYAVEVDLYKVINSNNQYDNYSPIKFIKTVVSENIRMTWITSMYQSIIDGELTIASDKGLLKLDLGEEEIDEK